MLENKTNAPLGHTRQYTSATAHRATSSSKDGKAPQCPSDHPPGRTGCGDPLGPALFCLWQHPGLRRTLAELNRRHPGVPIQLIAQLNDVRIQTLRLYVGEALTLLKESWARYGLTMSIQKTKVLLPPDTIPLPLGGPHPTSNEGVVATGTAVGSDCYVQSHVLLKSEDAAEVFEDLSRVARKGSGVHRCLIVLRLCGSSQLVYHLRTHLPSQCREAAEHFDQHQWHYLAGTYLDQLPDESLRAQVGALPPRLAGAGVRPPGSLIDHAFVRGANLCVAHFTSHEDTFPLLARGLQPGSRTHHEYAAAIERLHQRLDPPSLAEAEDFLRPWSAVVTTPQCKVQHELQRLLDNTLWSALW